MSARQESIQRLLEAEESAQQIVNAARKQKTLKLKNSKEQADSEIAAYRSARETEYQRKLAQRSGDVGANADKLNSETRAKVDAIKVGVEQLKGEFVTMLVNSTVSTT